jgi:4-hydroxy-3-polyprenylbenzoate decarboxylase
MAYREFQDFLRVLEEKGELRRISEPVSPYLEITEISDRVMKAGGPALLFENVVGPAHRLEPTDPQSAVMGHPSGFVPLDGAVKYAAPVAINTMGTRRRMSLALGVEDFEEPPSGARDGLKKLGMLAGELKGVRPREVSSGVCQEVVFLGDEIDLTKLPVLTCWPEDGGPFITLPLVFTHDPNTGRRNVGMYRVQVYDARTCGMHWQMHKTGMRQMEDAGQKGQNLEVAVVLGGDPAYTFAAISPLPPSIDEMSFAGFLRRERVPLVKAKTVNVMIPADAEIVIEGYVDPTERRREGPFGDHTGYYSLAAQFPVLHVTAVTTRKKPVYPATIVGQPPMEDGWMGRRLWT